MEKLTIMGGQLNFAPPLLHPAPPSILKTPTYPFYLLFILCFPSTSSFSRSQHKFRPSPFQFFFSSWLNSALLLEVDVLILRFGSVSRSIKQRKKINLSPKLTAFVVYFGAKTGNENVKRFVFVVILLVQKLMDN